MLTIDQRTLRFWGVTTLAIGIVYSQGLWLTPAIGMVYSHGFWLTPTIEMIYSHGLWLSSAIRIQNKFGYVGLAFAPSTIQDFHLPNNNFTKEKLKETIKENKQAIEKSSIILHGYLSIFTYTSSTTNLKLEQGEQETHTNIYED